MGNDILSPAAFLESCAGRGIRLSLTQGTPPNVRVRATGELPPKVGVTIRENKTAIVAALLELQGVAKNGREDLESIGEILQCSRQTSGLESTGQSFQLTHIIAPAKLTSPDVAADRALLDLAADHDAELLALAADAETELANADPEMAARAARVAIAERGAVSIHITPEGKRLYEDRHGLFGYVPPGGAASDFIGNFPASMQATARRAYTRQSLRAIALPNRPRPKAV